MNMIMSSGWPLIFSSVSPWLILLSPLLYFFSKRIKDRNLSVMGQLLGIIFATAPAILIIPAIMGDFIFVAIPLNNISWSSQLIFLMMSLGVLFAVTVGAFEVKRIRLSSLRIISYFFLLLWFVMYAGTAIIQIHTMVFLHSNDFDNKTAGTVLAAALEKPCFTGYFYAKINQQAKVETYCPNRVYSSSYTHSDIPQIIYLVLQKDQVINYQKVNPLWSLTDWNNAKDNEQAFMGKITGHTPINVSEPG